MSRFEKRWFRPPHSKCLNIPRSQSNNGCGKRSWRTRERSRLAPRGEQTGTRLFKAAQRPVRDAASFASRSESTTFARSQRQVTPISFVKWPFRPPGFFAAFQNAWISPRVLNRQSPAGRSRFEKRWFRPPHSKCLNFPARRLRSTFNDIRGSAGASPTASAQPNSESRFNLSACTATAIPSAATRRSRLEPDRPRGFSIRRDRCRDRTTRSPCRRCSIR